MSDPAQPENHAEFDATEFSYPVQARSSEEWFDGPEYAARWDSRPGWERWSQVLPGWDDHAATPPEWRVSAAPGRFFGLPEDTFAISAPEGPDPLPWQEGPARFVQKYLTGIDAPDAGMLSYRMWTAMGRLYGCLHADRDPAAPRFALAVTPWGPRRVAASSDDADKLLSLARTAAREVVEEGWVDPHNRALDTLTGFDARLTGLPTFAPNLAGDAADHLWLIDPAVQHVWDRARADVPAAYTGDWRSAQDPHDAWRALALSEADDVAAELAAATRVTLPGLDVTDWLAPEIRDHVAAVPHMGALLNAAWRLLYIGTDAAPGPHPHCPAPIESPHLGETGPVAWTWTPASLTDRRLLLILTRQVADHLHELVARDEWRTGRPADDGAGVARRWLTRTLATIDSLTDDQVNTVTGAVGPTHPVKVSQTPAAWSVYLAAPARDRWMRSVPDGMTPPEVTGLIDVDGDFNPATLLGDYLGDVDPEYAERGDIGHAMWTAIGRLYGCLHSDRDPACPSFTPLNAPAGTVYACASLDDLNKLLTLVHEAADAVAAGWVDPARPERREVTDRDQYLVDRLPDTLDPTKVDHAQDTLWLASSPLDALWDRARREVAILNRYVLDEDNPVASVNPYPLTPDEPLPLAQVVAAAAGRTSISDPSIDLEWTDAFTNLWRQADDPVDAWHAVPAHALAAVAAELAAATQGAWPNLDVTDLLDPTWRVLTRQVPGLSELVNIAWRLLAVDYGNQRPTDPHHQWPAIVETTIVNADLETGYTWALAGPADQNRMMNLLAAAADHLHLDVARAEVRNQEWLDDGANVARHALTRRLAGLPTWPRAQIAQAASGRTAPRTSSHPGMTDANGRLWSHAN